MRKPTRRNHALIAARKDSGLSQTECGDAIGASLRQICRYETGCALPPIHRAYRLAHVLDATVDELFAAFVENWEQQQRAA